MKIEHLNLAALKYFIDTVEAQSFTEAAAKNHVSRPAISQAIRRLEEWSGQELLDHKKNNFHLTPQGEQFYQKARAAFEAFDTEMEGQSSMDQTLRLGCTLSLIDSHILPLLRDLSSSIKLDIKTGSSTQLKLMLREGRINVALFIDEFFEPGFLSETIQEGSFSLFSASGELRGPLILTEDRPEVIATRALLYKKALAPQIIRTESWGLAQKLANALDGTCLIPDCVQRGGLRKVRFSGLQSRYKVTLAYKRGEFLSETEVKFCKLIRKMKWPSPN